jgi:hypothetical protein
LPSRRAIVERLGQLAAALREEQARAVQRIGRLIKRHDDLLQARLTFDNGGTSGARLEMRIESGARICVQFVANTQDSERLDLVAATR